MVWGTETDVLQINTEICTSYGKRFLKGTYKNWCTVQTPRGGGGGSKELLLIPLKVHKNENFFGFDFEFCTISLLVMQK
jgi:hypothetical protein